MIVKSTARSTAGGDDDALYRVIRCIRPLHRQLAKEVENRLSGTDITVGMRAALETLQEQGPLTVPQIARSVGIRRQFIQRLVNAALELGLVRTTSNPAHRRSVLIELTPAGEATFERIHRDERAVLRKLAKSLERKDIDACLRVLDELSAYFRRVAKEEIDHE